MTANARQFGAQKLGIIFAILYDQHFYRLLKHIQLSPDVIGRFGGWIVDRHGINPSRPLLGGISVGLKQTLGKSAVRLCRDDDSL
ncbi:MAG: hypothetical protein ACK4N4_16160, partial [Burkholderiales bacterium]